MTSNPETMAWAKARAAIELRHASFLRRAIAARALPRAAAISAIRDCLRHARMLNTAAAILRGPT